MHSRLTKALAVMVLGSMCFAQSAFAAEGAAKKKAAKHAAKPAVEAVTAEDLKQLKDLLESQQKQLNDLKQQMSQRDQQLSQTQQALAEARKAADDAQAKASAVETAASEQKKDVADLRGTLTSTMLTIQDDQKRVGNLENPTSIHYKGVTLTPGGFLVAETLWRSHAQNADIISSYNGIPYDEQTNSKLSEFRFTARQSRMSLLAEGKIGKAKVSGYYEMDFLGAAPTANENQSSSFNPRIRQLYAQAAFESGWTFTGGQTWSLLTLNKSGISPRGEWVPATIDGQYVVGYDFARLATFRIAKSFNNKKTTVAFSVENPATLNFGASSAVAGLASTGSGSLGNSTVSSCTAAAGAAVSCTGSPTYSTNLAPDMIGKIAFDPGWGHYEVKGVMRYFRDRVLPPNATTPGDNHTTVGGGFGAGAILPVVKSKVDVIAEVLYGWGIARYGDSSNVKPTDNQLSPEENVHFLLGVETHPRPNLDIYFYGGDEYLGRNFNYGSPFKANVAPLPNYGVNNSTCFAEFGYKCSANMRNLAQFATGFWYRFYKGTMGTVQYGMQYSYTSKKTWASSATATAPSMAPSGDEHIIMTSFRYYLP